MTDHTDVRVATDPPDAPIPTSASQMSASDRLVIAVLLVSTFVVILNETIMSVALPVLLTDLQVTASVGQWLTAGFLLTMAVVIPITGYLIRRVSTRLLYGIAMGLFSLGTFVAAVAPGFAVLLVARVVQAGGTAIMLPLLMTTVMTLVPPARRGAVMGNISIVISVAPAIGPTVSGLVLSVLGWRFMFWLVLPIALVTLVLGLRRLIDIGEPTDTPIDIPSVILSVFGFGGLVYGLSTIGQEATGPALPIWVPFVVGGVGLVAFLARQLLLQRTDRALLDLRTFSSRTFTMATALMMLMMATLIGTIILLPIYTQYVLGLDPLATGLLLLPGGLLMGLLGPVVGRLYDRFGARALLVPWCRGHQFGALVHHAVRRGHLDPPGPRLPPAAQHRAGVRVHPAVHRRPRRGATAPLRLRQRDLRHHPTARGCGRGGPARQRAQRARGRLARAGATAVEQTAGGIHAAFLVAACLSLVAVAGAFMVRTPVQAEAVPVH